MRSLFTEDIPGAKPKHQYYDKALYFKKHLEEVSRHGRKNPEEKRVFQWYTPKQRLIQPIAKNSSIIKPHSRYYNDDNLKTEPMSKSVILNKLDSAEITGKVTEGISTRNNSSLLSKAGKKSLFDSFSREMDGNPYYPHRLPKKHEDNVSNLTGERGWNYEHVQQYNIPTADKHYFPSWS